jgi:hypothetical protein
MTAWLSGRASDVMVWLSSWLGKPEMAAAVTGAVVALLATWVREWVRERRRRLNVAAAFVADLRLQQRMVNHIGALAKGRNVYYWSPSDTTFRTLLSELAGLSPTAFRCVRQAYGQLQHCHFLVERFRELRKSMTAAEARDADNWDAAYEGAIQHAAELLDEALRSLRRHAPRSSYRAQLPALTPTDREREWTG